MVLFGQNLVERGLSTLKNYIDAQNKVVVDFMTGERDEWWDIVNDAFEHINIPRNVDGIEIDLAQPQRICTWIDRGEPYPRIGEETVTRFYLRPRKMGGMSEAYLEDLVGKSDDMIALRTRMRLKHLMTDFRLARLERAMLSLNTTVTANTTYQYDCAESNKCVDFTLAKLQDMVAKRKQNFPVTNMRDLFLVIPSDVENQLRKDTAFDNAPDVKEELILRGALPQTLMGLSHIIVNDQMPVLYDSTGKMLDAVAAPTGTYKLPLQFTDTAANLPPWLQDGAVAVSEWDEDKVARCVWLMEKNKAGYYLTQDLPPEFPAVELNLRDNSYDSIAMKIRGLMNFGVPTNVKGFGAVSLIRGQHIRLRTIA